MNTLESTLITSPFGEPDECAKFTIRETEIPFVLHDITHANQKYTFSCWIKSNTNSSISINGNVLDTSTDWKRHVLTFTANSPHLEMLFDTASIFYIYHAQLEIGNKPSDWVESPEDVNSQMTEVQDTADAANKTANDTADRLSEAETLIQQINGTISTLVRDANGQSLMTQTADGGWTFSMAQTQETLEKLQEDLGKFDGLLDGLNLNIETINSSLADIETDIEWIQMTTYEDEPCIALGETGSDFRLLITNTRIIFLDGADAPAYISNKALNITKAVIKEELQQGPFVWKIRANGNMGLLWKGGAS